MKRVFVLSSMMALGVAVLLASSPVAQAACSTPVGRFGQIDYNCGGYYCYVTSPGTGTEASIEGKFWSLANGNPSVGSGSDNGGFDDADWLQRYAPTTPYYINCVQATGSACTWAVSASIDGCIFSGTDVNPPGHTAKVMVAAFSDQNPSSYGVVAVEDAGQAPNFNFAVGSDVALQPVPSPVITGSTRVSDTQVDVQINCPDLTGAFVSDGTVTAGEVILGCRFYQQELSLGSPAPTNVNITSAGWVQKNLINNNTPGTVSVTCAGDSSNYLGLAVEMADGFVMPFATVSSEIGCGPTAADPLPRFKYIDRKGVTGQKKGR